MKKALALTESEARLGNLEQKYALGIRRRLTIASQA